MKTHYNDLLSGADYHAKMIDHYENELEHTLLKSHKFGLQEQLRIHNAGMRNVIRQIWWEDTKMQLRMLLFKLRTKLTRKTRDLFSRVF